MPSATPSPGSMWGHRPLSCTPAPCRRPRPCLLAAAAPAQGCTTPPAAPPPASLLPGNMPISLLHPALTVVHCSGVRARGAEGLPGAWTPLSESPLISEPLAASLPAPCGLRASLTGTFWGRIFCLFVSLRRKKKKKKAFSLVEGWLCFGGLFFFPGFVWFSFLQASRRCTSSPHLSFSCSLLLHRCHTLAVLTSPIPPYNKVCTSHTPAASQGLHYITVGLLLLLPSLPGNRHRPLPATIHTAT